MGRIKHEKVKFKDVSIEADLNAGIVKIEGIGHFYITAIEAAYKEIAKKRRESLIMQNKDNLRVLKALLEVDENKITAIDAAKKLGITRSNFYARKERLLGDKTIKEVIEEYKLEKDLKDIKY